VVFVTGAAVGAVLLSRWERKPAGIAAEVEPHLKVPSQPVRAKRHAAAAEVPLAAPPVPSIDPPPVEASAVVPPVASHHAPARPAYQPTIPPTPAASAPVRVPAPPSAVAAEQALLGDILQSLRKHHDPQTALAMLEDHARRFPGTALAPEAAMLRVEAWLGLGRKAEALAVLDRLSLESMPNRDERLVLRGELRAGARRWLEARMDFEPLLSDLSSAGSDPKSREVKERALWGRASVRSHLGDQVGARADLALYLRTFPSGRFVTQAAALLQGSP
jgi:hypothetical protein